MNSLKLRMINSMPNDLRECLKVIETQCALVAEQEKHGAVTRRQASTFFILAANETADWLSEIETEDLNSLPEKPKTEDLPPF